MTDALRIAAMACRVVALALCAYVVLTGWRPVLDALAAHEVRLELRPRALPPELPRWT